MLSSCLSFQICLRIPKCAILSRLASSEERRLLQDVLSSLKVALGTQNAVFSAAVGARNDISVAGTVKGGAPYLTRIGSFTVDLQLGGIVLLVRQARPAWPRVHPQRLRRSVGIDHVMKSTNPVSTVAVGEGRQSTLVSWHALCALKQRLTAA